MKKLLTAAFLVLLCSIPAMAQNSVKVSWDASATTGVSYNLYRSKAAGGCATAGPQCVKVNTTAVAVLTFTDTTLATSSGRWFYVVRAIDADGIESANSNELAVILPPATPANLRQG